MPAPTMRPVPPPISPPSSSPPSAPAPAPIAVRETFCSPVLGSVTQPETVRSETMAALEERLASRKFLRVSRSAMVNSERIKELQPLFHGDYVIILRSGAKVTLSRNYKDKLKELGLT